MPNGNSDNISKKIVKAYLIQYNLVCVTRR